MKTLEYEAKQILAASGIAVPKSFIISDKDPEFLPAVIKSQVPVGGRGKAGGVAIVTTPTQFTDESARIKTLPIKGFTPKTLLAEQALAIKHEYYLSLLIDRQAASIVLMAHTSGGIDVEDHDASDFQRITLTPQSLEPAGDTLADYFDLPEKSLRIFRTHQNLYNCFVRNDATLLEINPLVLTEQGDIVAGDCKMELDDAAAFCHPEWQFEQEHTEANFVTLDQSGEVATIANGAGLAMATVDAVADAGMRPANFLDIGGGGQRSQRTSGVQTHHGIPKCEHYHHQHLCRYHPLRRNRPGRYCRPRANHQPAATVHSPGRYQL